MKKLKQKQTKEKTDGEIFDIDISPDLELNTCSAGDCTGLIPSAAENEGEVGAYEELYPFLPPRTDNAE